MIITYKNLNLINFPIYGLPSDDLEVTDGLLRIGSLVVDDRNQIGETLGARRLQTPHMLLPLRRCYEETAALLSATAHRVFVDSKGYCFIYQRTKLCQIVYHKVLKVIPKDIITVLKVSNVSFPVVVQRPPPPGKNWVGMLYFNRKPWIPYEYAEEKCATKRRKI